MSNAIHLHYDVSGEDFTRAGEASGAVKKTLRRLGYNNDAIRRVAISMYEAEINMVIHAEGGYCDVDIYPDRVEILLSDHGPGIPDVEKAMQEGFSTAPDNVRTLGFGAGMGLPNIKKYTDDMRIETTIGVGTNVYLTVTVCAAAAPTVSSAVPPRRSAFTAARRGSSTSAASTAASASAFVLIMPRGRTAQKWKSCRASATTSRFRRPRCSDSSTGWTISTMC